MKKLLFILTLGMLYTACSSDIEDTIDVPTVTTFTEANVGFYDLIVGPNHANYDEGEYLAIDITRTNVFWYSDEECRESLFAKWDVSENTPTKLRLDGGDIMIFTRKGNNIELYYEDDYDGWNYTLLFESTQAIAICN